MSADESTLFTELRNERLRLQTRRHFLRTCATGMGAMFFALTGSRSAADYGLDFSRPASNPFAPLPPQFPARAKRVCGTSH